MNDKKDKASRGWPFLLAALWLACAVWLVAQKWAAINGLGLPDTDDNLRLQQVRDWLAGQAWFDLRQHRAWKSVVSGKSVSVRVELGRRRTLNKHTNQQDDKNN